MVGKFTKYERTTKYFFLADCLQCYGGVVPFYSQHQRDEWATAHARSTSHDVVVLREVRVYEDGELVEVNQVEQELP